VQQLSIEYMTAQSASSAQKVEINAPFDVRIKTGPQNKASVQCMAVIRDLN